MDIFRETQVFAHLGITAFYFVRILFNFFPCYLNLKGFYYGATQKETSAYVQALTGGFPYYTRKQIWFRSCIEYWHLAFNLASVQYQLLKIFVVKKAIFFLIQPYQNKQYLTELEQFHCCKCFCSLTRVILKSLIFFIVTQRGCF